MARSSWFKRSSWTFGRRKSEERNRTRSKRDSFLLQSLIGRRLGFESLEDRRLLSITWGNMAGGEWNVASNWVGGALPGSSDDVVIPTLNGGAVVTVGSTGGNVSVHSVTSQTEIIVIGTMTVSGNVQMASSDPMLLDGTLANATITAGSTVSIGEGGGHTLSNVTVAAGATIEAASQSVVTQYQNVPAAATIINGLTLNGSILLGSTTSAQFGQLSFVGVQTLSGNGSILFGDSGSNQITAGAAGESGTSALTIGSGITIHGASGGIGTYGGTDTLVNDGTVLADTPASASGLNLSGGFTNAGSIGSSSGGTLVLTTVTFAPTGVVSGTGGTTVLEGSLSNATIMAGSTLSIGEGAGHTLSGITVDAGAMIEAASQSVNTQYQNTPAAATIINGMILNGTILLGSPTGVGEGYGSPAEFGQLSFVGVQTLSGNGNILFGTSYENEITAGAAGETGPSTLTVASGITVHGAGGTIGTYAGTYTGSDTLVNDATIIADASGAEYGLILAGLTNAGSIGSSNSGSLVLDSVTGTPSGRIIGSGGTTILQGTLANSTIASGATLVLGVNSAGSRILSNVTVAAGATIDAATQSFNSPQNFPAAASIINGMTLNGTILLGSPTGQGANYGSPTGCGQLYFLNVQTLSGNGSIVFGTSESNYLIVGGFGATGGSTLTVGNGITLEGAGGAISTNSLSDAFINEGTIFADAPGSVGGLSLGGEYGTFINAGSVGSSDGGILSLVSEGNTIYGPAAQITFTATGKIIGTGGTTELSAGVLINPTIVAGATLTLTRTGGTLSGLTVDAGATLDAPNSGLGGINFTSATVTNGLVLNGTLSLEYGDLLFAGTQTISGDGSIIMNAPAGGSVLAAETGGSNPATLTVGNGISIIGEAGSGSDGQISDNSSNSGSANATNGDSVINEGSITINASGQSIIIGSGHAGDLMTGFTAANISNGATIVGPSMDVNGSSIISVSPNSSLSVAGSLLGNTTNPAAFNPQGTITLDGGGTSTAPNLLEAMSADDGAVSAGFTNNFAYGKLILAGNSYVSLVDQSVNTTSGKPEALYANALLVNSGCTLNLNGLNVYVRTKDILGTVTGGSIIQIPSAGVLPLNVPTPGDLSTTTQVDHWTFYGRAGSQVIVAFDSVSGPSALARASRSMKIQVLDPSNNVLATGTGEVLTLSALTLAVSGTYTITVQPSTASNLYTGNYTVAAYFVTPSIKILNLNQTSSSTIATPYSIDQWNFAASAGTQVQFNLAGTSTSGLLYSLTGPNGFSAFSNSTTSSGLITLPTGGTYSLSVQSSSAMGSYAFTIVQTAQSSLTLGTNLAGSFVGSGQAQLYSLVIPTPEPLSISVTDSASVDHVELYAELGSPPTRQTYGYAANGAGSSQSLLISSAVPGTWYILVYAESVAAAPSSFTLLANTAPVVVSAVTPATYAANTLAYLTLNGAGFSPTDTVALVAANGTTVYPASSVAFETFTQIAASFNLSNVPQGTYSVRVTDNFGGNSVLPGAFTVTTAGTANLQTQLILPSAIGRHITATFYVKYSNTGTAAMAAPVLLLESSVANDLPLFTLNKSLLVSGLFTSALPQGYSNTVEILASGKVPGLLEPGESFTVPVYYAGMEQPWNLGETQFKFDIRVFTNTDNDVINWTSLQSSLQPAGVSNSAWAAIYTPRG